MAAIVSSDFPPELTQKTAPLLAEFEQALRDETTERELNPLLVPVSRNHNRFVGLDSAFLHVVYTTEGVTSGVITGTERDLRSKGALTQSQVVSACVRELGFKDAHYFGIPSSALNQRTEERKPLLRRVASQYLDERIEPLKKLESLGLSEALTYLQNARSRFETRTPEGFSDCKANCRNALVSCMKSLTSQEDMREGARILRKKGVLGEREEELAGSLGETLSKLYGVASKKGAHPPLANANEAELVLGLTTSIITFLCNQAIQFASEGS